MTTLAHLSDLHFGAQEPALVVGLHAALNELRPDLVVVSGDLTQRARRAQFRAARAFLDGLEAPWLAVPGNHDIPGYDLVRRLLLPRNRFRHFVTDGPASLAVLPGARVLGLDSTRRRVLGRLQPCHVQQIARLDDGPPTDLRVLVTHHPLVREKLTGAPAALQAAVAAHVEVLLAGHMHLAFHERIDSEPGLGLLVVQAGTATSHRRRKREPANSFNVLRWDGTQRLDVELWRWTQEAFAAADREAFERAPGGWRTLGSRQPPVID